MTSPADSGVLVTPLLINGAERSVADSFPVYDPARAGTVVGYAASDRAAIVLKALDGLDADADARAETLSRENGKLRFEAAIDLQAFVGRFHQARVRPGA